MRTHHAESDALFARARALLQEVQESAGDHADHLFQLARAYEGPAWYHLQLKCYAKAEEDYRKALALWERQVTDFPDDMARRSHLAESHCGLARALQATGRKEDAAAHFGQSVRLQEQVVARPPVNPDHRGYLSATYNEYGRSLEHLSRAQEAEQQYRQSLRVSAELAEDFPHVPAYRDLWRNSYYSLSQILHRERRSGDAEPIVREVVDLAEHLVVQWPTIPSFQQQLATARIDHGFDADLPAAGCPRQSRNFNGRLRWPSSSASTCPMTRENRMIWARATNHLGVVLRTTQGLPAAEQAYRKAMSAMETLDRQPS